MFNRSLDIPEIYFGSCEFSGQIAVSMAFKLEVSEWKLTGPSP